MAKRPVASPRYGHTGDHEVRLPVESSASAVSTAQFPHSVGGDHLLLDELQTRHRSYQRPIAAERKSLTSTSSTHSFPLQEHPIAYGASASPDCHVDAPQEPAILAILLQLQEQMKATQEEMKALQSNQQSTVPRSSADVAEAPRSSEIDLLRAENARLRNEALMRDLDVGPSLRDRSKNIPKVDIHDLQSSFATFLTHCKFLRLTSDADILDAALSAFCYQQFLWGILQKCQCCELEEVYLRVVPSDLSMSQDSVASFFCEDSLRCYHRGKQNPELPARRTA